MTNLITSESMLKEEQRHLESRTWAALLKEMVAIEIMGQYYRSQTLPAENGSQKWQSRADDYCLQLSSTRIKDRWHRPKPRANCMLGKHSALKGTQLKQLVLWSGQEDKRGNKKMLKYTQGFTRFRLTTLGFIFCKHYNHFTTRFALVL